MRCAGTPRRDPEVVPPARGCRLEVGEALALGGRGGGERGGGDIGGGCTAGGGADDDRESARRRRGRQAHRGLIGVPRPRRPPDDRDRDRRSVIESPSAVLLRQRDPAVLDPEGRRRGMRRRPEHVRVPCRQLRRVVRFAYCI